MLRMTSPLTQHQRDSYAHIIATGEAALIRLSAGNPMRASIALNIADARARLEVAA